MRQLVHDGGALPVAGGPAERPGGRGRGALLLDHLGELQAATGLAGVLVLRARLPR